MLAIGSADAWDGHSLRLALLQGTHCPLCGNTTTWTRGAWSHFFSDCAGARLLLQQPPALDWILLLSTTMSPGFALFLAATILLMLLAAFLATSRHIVTFLLLRGETGGQTPCQTPCQ